MIVNDVSFLQCIIKIHKYYCILLLLWKYRHSLYKYLQISNDKYIRYVQLKCWLGLNVLGLNVLNIIKKLKKRRHLITILVEKIILKNNNWKREREREKTNIYISWSSFSNLLLYYNIIVMIHARAGVYMCVDTFDD